MYFSKPIWKEKEEKEEEEEILKMIYNNPYYLK